MGEILVGSMRGIKDSLSTYPTPATRAFLVTFATVLLAIIPSSFTTPSSVSRLEHSDPATRRSLRKRRFALAGGLEMWDWCHREMATGK